MACCFALARAKEQLLCFLQEIISSNIKIINQCVEPNTAGTGMYNLGVECVFLLNLQSTLG